MLAPSPIIWLSHQEDVEELVAAFQVGIRGYIPTSMEPQVIIQAIRMVLSGGAFFPATPRARTQLALRREKVDCRPAANESEGQGECAEARAPARPEVADQLRHWPRRQLSVLALIVAGKANKDIAEILEMDESTVKSHMRQIMRKLGVTNRTQVALCGRKLGVIPAD